MEFTDQAALLYLQEGMVFSQLSSMGIDNQPSSRQAILNHPFLMMYLRTKAREIMEFQGKELLQDIGYEPRTVLDIGCGLGLCSLALYQEMETKPTLFLVDGGREFEKDTATYMNTFNDDGTDFVSDLRITMDLLLRNGVPQEKMNFLGPVADNVASLKPGSIDLVFSNASWFYHYPPEIYWDAVQSVMHKDSTLRVDIQVNYLSPHPEHVDFLKERFLEVEELRYTGMGEHPRKSLTVLAKYPL